MPDMTQAQCCPFCGLGAAVITGGPAGPTVRCVNKKCRVKPTVSANTRDKALTAWNARAVDPELPRLVFIERQLRNVVYNIEQSPEQRTVVQLAQTLRSVLGLKPGERP